MDAHDEILYPPLATITPTDQRGVAWVVGIITLSHVYLTLALRISVRWRRFQPDDFTLIAACVLDLCQTSIAFGAVGLGCGWAEMVIHGDKRTSTTWRLFLASEGLFIVALFVAKVAVLLTVQSLLARDMTVRMVFHCTLGAIVLLGLISLLVVTIGCGGDNLLASADGSCNQVNRWIIIAVLDAVSELWTFSLFCWVVWSLQMKAAYKITATAMIGMRLFCIVFGVLHVHYMGVYENAALPAVTIIQPLIWQNLSLTWSLLSAMAMALKPFLKDFHTGMGMDLGHVTESNYGSASKKYAKQGYVLQNMSPNRSKDSKAPEESVTVAAESTRRLTEGDRYAVEIYHGRKPSLGTSSMRSDDPIIRKQVDYDVTYDALKTV